MSRDVAIEIDLLRLSGFAPGNRRALVEALERELARLLAERGLPPDLAGRGEVRAIDAGSFVLPASCRPEDLGARLARALFDGLASAHGPRQPIPGGSTWNGT